MSFSWIQLHYVDKNILLCGSVCASNCLNIINLVIFTFLNSPGDWNVFDTSINIIKFVTIFSKMDKVLCPYVWIQLLNFEDEILIKRWLHIIVINQHIVILIKCNYIKVFNEFVDSLWLMA